MELFWFWILKYVEILSLIEDFLFNLKFYKLFSRSKYLKNKDQNKMNQLCKHLIVKNSFTKSFHAFNKLSYSKTPKFISLGYPISFNYSIKPINSDYQQIKINTPIRFYVTSSKPHSGLKPQLRKNTHTSIDADFKDAIPVESTGESDYGSATSDFSKFDLPVELLERLKQKGYIKPYEIQDSTLKHTLNGRDLVGKAFTGSGKTLGIKNLYMIYFDDMKYEF